MRIRVCSLNILHGGKYFSRLNAFLTELQADIMLLQEVYNGTNPTYPPNHQTVMELKRMFPQYYIQFSAEFFHTLKHYSIDIGNAIVSRYPIHDLKTVFLNGRYEKTELVRPDNDYSSQPKNMQIATIITPNHPLTVANLHGIWGFHGNDTPERTLMGQKIIHELKGKKNVILAGDFNLNEKTEITKRIQKYYKNVFSGMLKTSFNLKRKDLIASPGYRTSVVDMMFVSRTIKVISRSCPPVDVSDHLPLVATLEIT